MKSGFPLWQRIFAAFLIFVHLATAVPAAVVTAAVAPPPPSPPAAPAPSCLQPPAAAFAQQHSAEPHKPAIPIFDPPSRTVQFSANPTDDEIARIRCFEEPLFPQSRGIPDAENRALAAALTLFASAPKDVSPIVRFLEAHPDSRWRAALLTNLGLVYRNQGYWSKALDSWEKAWSLGRSALDTPLKLIIDHALGELAQLHARLGHFDRLETLFKEIDHRDVQGAGTERVAGARAGLALMKSEPSEAFRCGPLAISRLFQLLNPKQPLPSAVTDFKSTVEGTCLADMKSLAEKIGIHYQVAFRAPGAGVLTPSLVHWKVGHFACLSRPMETGYLSQDLTFGTDTLVTKDVLDTEASGYFLVPAGELPAGWRAVNADEAAHVFGKGDAGPSGPPPPPCTSPTAKGCVPCNGMAVYNMEFASVSLMLSDTPVGYAPPVGPTIEFVASYNHRESAPTANISNLGPKWNFSWLTFIVAPSSADTRSYGPGGGELLFTGMDTSGRFLSQLLNQVILVKNSDTSYQKWYLDGSKEVFDLADPGANPRILRTKLIDPTGAAVSFGYDEYYRMRTVTDAIGQVTTIDYELGSNPAYADFYKITKVTDPFGRSASFQYNPAGQLWKITDVIGVTSAFTYGIGDFVSSLETPYGVTAFTAADDQSGLNRMLEITDPLGAKERVEWRRITPAIHPEPSSNVPENRRDGNNYLTYRNTFYWDKKAMADAPGDYTKAKIYHWLHASPGDTSRIVPIPESIKSPLEGRVYFAYDGQLGLIYAGDTSRPNEVLRQLDDGSQQDMLFAYNPVGNVKAAADPRGRQTNYGYYANGVDIAGIAQWNGSGNDVLAEYTYNTQHLPLTVKDASGQTTSYSYNPEGQVQTVTNAKGEITTFNYTNHYLTSIDGPLAGSSDTTSFTYDGFGRVRTVADPTGYTVTNDYDAFDRPIKVTYPDGTYTQVLYNRLDPEWSRDRLGRWTHVLYDPLRHVSQVQDPLYRKTTYDWCNCGALTAITDPLGQRTSWTRDLQSRATEKIYADGRKDIIQYEQTTSRVKSVTDARGQVANYFYYVDDSIAAVTYSNPSGPGTPGISYGYDPFYPRVATMNDGVGTTHYAYNPVPAYPVTTPVTGAGRLASIDGPFANDTITYGYDELGRRLSTAVNGVANTTSVIYDTLGRLQTMTNLLGTFTNSYVGVTNRLDHIDYPNGQRTNYTYYPNIGPAGTGNGDQRLQQIQNLKSGGANISTFAYTYDAVGQIQTWNEQADVGPALNKSFRYDAGGQLVGASVASGASVIKEYAYGYDLAGNRTEEQADASVWTSAHNNLNQLTSQNAGGKMTFSGTLSEPGTVTLAGAPATVDSTNTWRGKATVNSGANAIPLVATDVNGNTTNKTVNVTVASGGSRTLMYDLNGNLTDDGAGKTYSWDALNRLVKISQASGVTEFIYNGLSQRVQEKTNGSVTKQWIWCGGPQPCEERNGSNVVTKRFFGGMGEQISGSSFFLTTDHLGSVREMTDSTGGVRARYDYDPYGRITKVLGDLEADFGFTGMQRHQESGLSLTLYRAYDPELGRWLSRDPAQESSGINLYAYVTGDPINAIDVLGLTGSLTIATIGFGQGGFGTHSWLIYRHFNGDGTIVTHSYGTYKEGYGDHGGLNIDREIRMSIYRDNITSSRATYLTDEEEGMFNMYLDETRQKGSDVWTTSYTCASFAADGWYMITHEPLSVYQNHLAHSTPHALDESIRNANGGQNHGARKTR